MVTIPPPIEYYGTIPATKAINPEQWALNSIDKDSSPRSAAIILIYGSWNVRLASMNRDCDGVPRWIALVSDALGASGAALPDAACIFAAASVRADADEESVDACVEGEAAGGLGAPPDLPALLLLGMRAATADGDGRRRPRAERVRIDGGALERVLTRPSASREDLVASVGDAWSRLFDAQRNSLPPRAKAGGSNGNGKRERGTVEPAIRIFVAGDRSRAGKSSVCMGLLGSLLDSGRYAPADLAYIKPATQCEEPQPVEEYCRRRGIAACVPVGPIVYYKGFTRAFLRGEGGVETSARMLRRAGDAVDDLARGRRVVVVDGVGYPAVGSVTGTDNADVARACGRPLSPPESGGGAVSERSPAPVLLVGKSGVGDAIDSFNLNATYFAHKGVPVIGSIFNKLSLDGFYSLSNCKEAIDAYFARSRPGGTAFGFVPRLPSLAEGASEGERPGRAAEAADRFVEEFSRRVDVDGILRAAAEATAPKSKGPARGIDPAAADADADDAGRPRTAPTHSAKYGNDSPRNDGDGSPSTRRRVEAAASAAGAAGG